jgi:hypothetical protein
MAESIFNVLFLCTGNATFRYLKTRVALFTALPLHTLDEIALSAKLREIGQCEDATSPRPSAA